LDRISKLARLYGADILLMESPQDTRRCERVQNLVQQISAWAGAEKIKVRFIGISRVGKVFKSFGAKTKYEIAHQIARQIPDLVARLPRFRKPWMSEDHRMGIFDAAALALTYFYSSPIRTKSSNSSRAQSGNDKEQ